MISLSAYSPRSARELCRASAWLRRLLWLLAILAVALFLARAPLTWSLALVSAAIGGTCVLITPHIALYALAFTVPFGSLFEFSLSGLTLGADELVLAALLAAWLLRMAALRTPRMARAPMALPLLVYLGTLVASLWPAGELIPALKELSKWLEFLFLYLFVAWEVTHDGARGKNVQQRFLAALFLAGILEGGLGIYQFVRQVGPPGFILLGRYVRAYGTFAQPNPFGGYMGLLLPLAYSVVLTTWREACDALRRQRGPQRRNLQPAALWLLALLASLVMLAALVMSWSRGALLGLALGGVLVVLALGRRMWLAGSIVVLVLFLLAGDSPLAPNGLLARLTDTLQYTSAQSLTEVEINDENFAVIERAAHWYAAWRMFDLHPWLGVGVGQYASVYPSVSVPRWQDPLGHAHNYLLQMMAEGGLAGLAGYLVLAIAALVQAWRGARRGQGWGRTVALGALGMLGHLTAHNMVDNLYVHGMYLVVAIVLGMLAWPGPGRSNASPGYQGVF